MAMYKKISGRASFEKEKIVRYELYHRRQLSDDGRTLIIRPAAAIPAKHPHGYVQKKVGLQIRPNRILIVSVKSTTC